MFKTAVLLREAASGPFLRLFLKAAGASRHEGRFFLPMRFQKGKNAPAGGCIGMKKGRSRPEPRYSPFFQKNRLRQDVRYLKSAVLHAEKAA